MKKILLSILSLSFFALQAQIFINNNPNLKTEKTTTTTTVTPPAVETSTPNVETTVPKVEVKSPEMTKPVVTAPKVTAPVVTTPALTTPTVTSPKVEAPVVTAPKVESPKVTSAPVSNYAAPSTYSAPSTKVAAAGINEDVPPNAEPGKCYARCYVEDKYAYVNETVVDQPKSIKQVKLPALYKTVYDTVIITPASTKKYQVPAQYETIEEQVMVTPVTTKWVKGKADAGCLSANPADCQVMCLVEVPAVYKTVTKEVLKNQAYTREETTPMQYKIVSKEVLVQEERLVNIETPASYKTVQKRVVSEKGGYEIWREILCGDDLTAEKIIQIQKALLAKGYNPGPIDDVFGPLTKAALVQYQKDKGLPVGNLNIETLKSLGVL